MALKKVKRNVAPGTGTVVGACPFFAAYFGQFALAEAFDPAVAHEDVGPFVMDEGGARLSSGSAGHHGGGADVFLQINGIVDPAEVHTVLGAHVAVRDPSVRRRIVKAFQDVSS